VVGGGNGIKTKKAGASICGNSKTAARVKIELITLEAFQKAARSIFRKLSTVSACAICSSLACSPKIGQLKKEVLL